jgi:protoporphyrinogen oxidase
MNVGVIGAGPAGLTAAYELSKQDGVKVEVVEASDRVGGMAGTVTLWGQKVDYGPHRFFSNDPRANAIWREAVGGRCADVNRLTRIFYGGKFYYYPLRAGNVLANLGVLESVRCLWSYLHCQFMLSKRERDATFESWVSRRFGRRLYETFFKVYSEKLWGIPCHELDADFATQRIKKFSVFEAVKAMMLGNKGNKHKTLVDRFSYPLEGAGAVYEAMRQGILQRGGTVRLRAAARRVVVEEGRATGIELEDGTVHRFDHVVSSMPITRLIDGLTSVPPEVTQAARQLRFRNTILVYLLVDGCDLFPDNWIYVHAKEMRCGRITNFRNWVPDLYGASRQTIVALEYWCYDGDALWHAADARLIALASAELQAIGMVRGATIVDGHVERLAWSYPVYFKGYKAPLGVLEAYLKTIENLSVVGRYGAYKYNNQDHSMLMGWLAARVIAWGESHDLWKVNADDEYQEGTALEN